MPKAPWSEARGRAERNLGPGLRSTEIFGCVYPSLSLRVKGLRLVVGRSGLVDERFRVLRFAGPASSRRKSTLDVLLYSDPGLDLASCHDKTKQFLGRQR